eukprot:4893728-Pyramimonas_sp.AAC.1
MFQELLLGLSRAMTVQGVDRNHMMAAAGAAEALNAICAQVNLPQPRDPISPSGGYERPASASHFLEVPPSALKTESVWRLSVTDL